MKYFCIENTGEIDSRAFRILGMSSKVGSENIGQFGTGNKYGIAAVKRAGLELVITSGSQRLDFVTKKNVFRDTEFNQIFIRESGKKRLIETALTVEMGEKNWSINEAIREFVSNALDEGGFKWFETEDITAEEGLTRIYIEWDIAVAEYFAKIDNIFLQDTQPLFTNEEGSFKLYRAADNGKTRIYRRGVLVYESDAPCAYYYEFDDIPLPESRLASDWDVRWRLGWHSGDIPVQFMSSFMTAVCSKDHFERLMYHGSIRSEATTWKEFFKDTVLVTNMEYQMHPTAFAGFKVRILPDDFVSQFDSEEGFLTAKTVLPLSRLDGWEDSNVGSYEESLIVKSIKFLSDMGYSISREDIVVANNSSATAALGQFVGGKIYINSGVFRRGFDEVLDTITHELFHKISHGLDESRDFENYLIKECLYHMKRRAEHDNTKAD